MRQEFGQRGPNQPGSILSLAPGQTLQDIVFRLIPAAVITGRVYDEEGEPIAGATIQAKPSLITAVIFPDLGFCQ